jgi:hypothetical protein
MSPYMFRPLGHLQTLNGCYSASLQRRLLLKLKKKNIYVIYCDVFAVGNRATVECDVNNKADALAVKMTCYEDDVNKMADARAVKMTCYEDDVNKMADARAVNIT